MSTVRKIAKNTTVLFISQILSYILGFFGTMYTARYLGADGFGILSTALALTGIFAVFTDMGLSTLTIREVSRDTALANKYLTNTAVLRVLLTFLTFGLIGLTVFIMGYPPLVSNVIYIITLSYLFGAISGVFFSIFQAHEDMEYQALGNIINSIFSFAGILFVIFYALGIIAFASIYLVTGFILLVYCLIIYAWKYSLPKMKIDLSFWKPTIMLAIPLSVISIFSVIAFKVDTVMLSAMKGNVIVGWYSASYNLMVALLFLPGVFSSAVFPVFSSFFVSSKDSLKFSYKKSFKYLTMISLPIAVGTMLLAKPIILLIYSIEYLPSILILQILIWTIPITFLNYVFGSMIPAMNRQNLLLKITFVSMVLNITLNLVLIPKFSYIGASVVTLITEFSIFILCFYTLSRSFCKISYNEVLTKPILASIIMGLFIYFTKLNLFVEIIMGAIIYFVAMILLKGFSEEDKDIFR
ncbi:MAG: flippase, partial [Methanobacterium paludis]|nr:flippase [Methanobacterium paludis]